jgi:S-DNA-T family DNA segregation ATPase FtsK/SpoIIIE
MTVDINLRISHGDVGYVALSKAPHILIAGMTGGGKSVVVHDLIIQLMQPSPKDVSLILIDPKRVEFGQYRNVPHLPLPPAYEDKHIEYALKWTLAEMHARFERMEQVGARDVSGAPWPRIVVVIDELANLVLKGKHLERPLVEIASMGRAAGVHLILATQRPSADVITGLIRANVPTRVCMPVITKTESRIVLDEGGAELLENPGDMLMRLPGQRQLIRSRGFHVTQPIIDDAIAKAIHAYC